MAAFWLGGFGVCGALGASGADGANMAAGLGTIKADERGAQGGAEGGCTPEKEGL
jgi:hypothetical protein